MTDDDANPWDWGRLVDKSGELIPPGACDPYHSDDQGRDRSTSDE